MSRTGTGMCRWCGNLRIVKAAPDNATQQELDDIATDECSCDGAKHARTIRYLTESAMRSIDYIVSGRSPEAARILVAGAWAVAAKQIRKITVDVNGAMTASMHYANGKVIVKCKKTEMYLSEGETEDDPLTGGNLPQRVNTQSEPDFEDPNSSGEDEEAEQTFRKTPPQQVNTQSEGTFKESDEKSGTDESENPGDIVNTQSEGTSEGER